MLSLFAVHLFQEALRAAEEAEPRERQFALGIGLGRAAEAGEFFWFEDAQQLILEREEELVGARIALAGRAADELAIDAGRAVHFGGDYVQSACRADFLVELDVGPASGHVRRDGDGERLAGPGDDLGFLLVPAGVQNLVFDPAPFERATERLGRVDRGRA